MRVPSASLADLETDLQESEQAVLSRYAAEKAVGGGELYSTMPALSDSGAHQVLHPVAASILWKASITLKE
jgi:hypothetical protein